jgi:hypothetical protein
MKKMVIFDPAMCCSTGVCGPSVDKDLLRVAAVLNNLKNKDIAVERHNLSNNPKIFVDNKVIRKMLIDNGVNVLPITMVDDVVVKTKAYPTDEEFCAFLEVPLDYIKAAPKKPTGGCGCEGGHC